MKYCKDCKWGHFVLTAGPNRFNLPEKLECQEPQSGQYNSVDYYIYGNCDRNVNGTCPGYKRIWWKFWIKETM